jgi:hypothetical protein
MARRVGSEAAERGSSLRDGTRDSDTLAVIAIGMLLEVESLASEYA